MLRDQLGQTPIVLDSGEVLKAPAKVLQRLCERIGLPFEAAMLQWEAGPRPEDGVWAKYWYHNVHRSTGFAPPSNTIRPLPPQCEPLYQEALPYYEALKKLEIKGAER